MGRQRSARLFAVSFIAAMAFETAGHAESVPIDSGGPVITVSPEDDVESELQSLSPGDTLELTEGTYQTGERWDITLEGTIDAPIVVRAAYGADVVIEGIPSQNVIDLDGHDFVIRDLEITGGSHGIRLGSTRDARFESLEIHDVGDVGISCNRPGSVCERIQIRDTEIWNTGMNGTGEGMYLGCNNDDCRIIDSTISGNFIHDTRAGSQGDGIDLKPGSWGNSITDNVFFRTKYPAVLVSSFPAGPDKPRNEVEGNLIVNTSDNGIQLAGQAIVQNNIVVGATASGIASKPDPLDDPHDATIAYNTVYDSGGQCVRGNAWNVGSNNLLANNALYCPGGTAVKFPDGPGGATIAGNIVLGALDGASTGFMDGVGASEDLGDPDNLVLYPPAGSALVDAADASAYSVAEDFDHRLRRTPPDVGAYERRGDGPAWDLGEGFKGVPRGGGDADAGMGAPDAGIHRDAGDMISPDASMAVDAGADAAIPTDAAGPGAAGGSGGCTLACARETPASGVAIALVLAVWLARRRRAELKTRGTSE